jgi:hypothetical protein
VSGKTDRQNSRQPNQRIRIIRARGHIRQM